MKIDEDWRTVTKKQTSDQDSVCYAAAHIACCVCTQSSGSMADRYWPHLLHLVSSSFASTLNTSSPTFTRAYLLPHFPAPGDASFFDLWPLKDCCVRPIRHDYAFRSVPLQWSHLRTLKKTCRVDITTLSPRALPTCTFMFTVYSIYHDLSVNTLI